MGDLITFYLQRRLFRRLTVEIPGRMMRINCKFEQRSVQHVKMGMMQLSLGTGCPVQMQISAHGAFLDLALLSGLNSDRMLLSWAGGLTRSPVVPSNL